MPLGQTVAGPEQVNNAFATNPVISQQFTLLGQQGSTVIQGGLQLIPINNSLMYIRPIYVQAASGSQLPAFQYVVVYYAGRTVLDTSLDGAMAQLFQGKPPLAPGQTGQNSGGTTTTTTQPPGTGTTTTTTPIPGNATVLSLVQQATAAYNDAQAALKTGDLAGYQRAVDRIGQLLAAAQRIADASTPTTTTTKPPTSSSSTPAPSA
jgi:uncharacterized membrane protein (UPF0182 family)